MNDHQSDIEIQVDKLLDRLTRRYRSLERQLRIGSLTAQEALSRALKLDAVLKQLIVLEREHDRQRREATTG